jgi:hypothetical protein
MTWNREKVVDYFMSQYGKYNPDQYKFRANAHELSGLHDTELALQKLYLECASAAFEKRSLLAKLDQLIKYGADDMKAYNSAEYKSMLKLEAVEIKKKIENDSLFF